MINFIQSNVQEITITSTSITMGYAPGNLVPPDTLVIWAASTATITLPPINTLLPSNTNTNYQVGAGSIQIKIKSLSGQIVNISGSALTGDKIWDVLVISSSGARVTLLGSLSDATWYLV